MSKSSLMRTVVVMIGGIALTTLSIDATDALRGSQSALSILTDRVASDECPAGTTLLSLGEGDYCIDTYENAPGDNCLYPLTKNTVQTTDNIASSECQAVSESERVPWTFVSYHQAKELCIKKNMRLPTAAEWYEAAIGSKEQFCNIDGTLSRTGSTIDCTSVRGIYDMVGNAWEWVDASVVEGTFEGRPFPAEGYVADVDTSGVPLATDSSPSPLYEDDYVWSKPDGVFAMMRGGYFGSRSDAGVFATHAEVETSFSGSATGFRCITKRD